ncbi:MAG: hypothetical protein ACRD3B_13855 [Candidatus Sulfotelmatobacter sp.]
MPSSSAARDVNLGYVIFLAATAALGGLLFGFDIAIITGAGRFLVRHFGLNNLRPGMGVQLIAVRTHFGIGCRLEALPA